MKSGFTNSTESVQVEEYGESTDETGASLSVQNNPVRSKFK